MSFNRDFLQLVSPSFGADDSRASAYHWSYATSDPAAAIDAGYFAGAIGALRPGDVVRIAASDATFVVRVSQFAVSSASLGFSFVTNP